MLILTRFLRIKRYSRVKFRQNEMERVGQRERLWGQLGGLSSQEFLGLCNPKESKNMPDIPGSFYSCASRKADPRYPPRHAQASFR